MKRKGLAVLLVLTGMIFCRLCADVPAKAERDHFQAFFKAGKIVALKNGIATYRLNGVKIGRAYGYCAYNKDYQGTLSGALMSEGKIDGKSLRHKLGEGGKSVAILKHSGQDGQSGDEAERYLNSPCYTIIAPVFDYAQAFSEGWGAVCRNGKWTYVSASGELLSNFIFDAAYPFRNGKAQVVYKGHSLEIGFDGAGLPAEARSGVRLLELTLKLDTIGQLRREGQYEMAILKGESLFYEIMKSEGKLKDLRHDEFRVGVQAAHYAAHAHNQLLSLSVKNTVAYSIYRDMEIPKRFSLESGHAVLNRCHARGLFEELERKFRDDDSIKKVIACVNELNFRTAIIVYEDWLKNRKVNPTAPELFVYYYLAELSCDFETANRVLLKISFLHARQGKLTCGIPMTDAAMLANMRCLASAEKLLRSALGTTDETKEPIGLAACHYNLALLYKDSGNIDSCLRELGQGQRVLKGVMTSERELLRELKNEILVEYISVLIENGLMRSQHKELVSEYVTSEIQHGIDLLSKEDTLTLNAKWGMVLRRIDRFLQHLPACTDEEYLESAFRLSIFQANVLDDVYQLFMTFVRNPSKDSTFALRNRYLSEIRNYKGKDLFSLEVASGVRCQQELPVIRLEKLLKQAFSNELHSALTQMYQEVLGAIPEADVVVNIVEYRRKSDRKFAAALVCRGRMKSIGLIPLGATDELTKESYLPSSVSLWRTIKAKYGLNAGDTCYLFPGCLNVLGLEYEDLGDGLALLQYNLHRVESLSNLRGTRPIEKGKRIALWGGLFYGDGFVAKSRGNVSSGYLESSKVEIDAIAEAMKNVNEVESCSGKQGTHDEFFSYDGDAPGIIHLATHGYQNTTLTVGTIEELMNRDRFDYYGQTTDLESREWLFQNTGVYVSEVDGVNLLTSREISTLDLRRCALVVLSACSTLKGPGGGIVRAFRLARARCVIASLNEVDDSMACEFMVAFYFHYRNSRDPYVSFRNTVREMRRRYPDRRECWGSFVYVENY